MVVARTELVREHRYFEQVSLCPDHAFMLLEQWPLRHGKLDLLFNDAFTCCKVVQTGSCAGPCSSQAGCTSNSAGCWAPVRLCQELDFGWLGPEPLCTGTLSCCH